MRKKIATLLLSFALLIPCILSFSACDKEKGKAKVTSIAVELVSTDYTMTDNTITIPYGKKVELDEDDFKVTATLEDNTTAEIHKKTETSDGYNFASTIPSDGITPRGEYTISFSHAQIESDVKVNVKVVSASVDMSGASWDYSNSFTYDKTAKQVSLTGLPNGVTVQYKTRLATDTTEGESGNSATNAGDYITTAIFTYIDAENYEAIPNKELTWKINKADINISSSDIVMETYNYDGIEKIATIKTTPNNITSNIVGGDTKGTNAGRYTVILSLEYTGEDKDNYNAISNINVDWHINSQVISTVNDITLQQTSFDYDSTEHETRVNLGELNNYFTGENPILSYSIQDNKKTNAGSYNAIITITVNNSNYTVDSAIIEKPWQINKATLTVKANDGSYVYGSAGANDATITGYKGNDKNLLEEYINYNLSIKTGTMEGNLFVVKTTGVFTVGEYVYRPCGLDGLTNYTPVYQDGTMTITKKTLKLSVNSKTNEGGVDNRNNCFALTYTGNAQGYTATDVTISDGLVYGDNASSIGLQFEYKECNMEIVESENWAWKFTEKSGAEWSDSEPINVGAYFVRVKDSLNNYSLSTECTIGKMYIKKAPIRLTIDDVQEEYETTQSEIGVTYTLGGELYYHIGYDYYELVGTYDESNVHTGYDYVANATFDGISSQIDSLLAYVFGCWQYDEEDIENPTFDECDFGSNYIAVGDYVIRLSSSAMTALNNLGNFEFVIIDGTLNVSKKDIDINKDNSKWIIDGDEIVEYVEEDTCYWCATREASSEAFAISFVRDEYSDILDVSYKITDGNDSEVNSISTDGEYTVIATITIKAGGDLSYRLIPNSEENTIAKLIITVYTNVFGTSTSGSDGEKTVSVTVTTTDSTTGGSSDAPLTFNEFASKTEFNEGDSFSFTLLNDAAGSTSSEPQLEPEEDEITAQFDEDEGLIQYVVTFNDEVVNPNSYGVYTVYLNSTGTGLIIKKVVYGDSGETQVEVFAKRNFKIKRISGGGGNNESQEGELPQIDVPDTYKIGNKDIETRSDVSPYYKLSADQTTITITIAEEYVNTGLYIFVNDTTSYEITSTTMTIDVYSMIGVGGSIALGTYIEMYGETARYICSSYANIVPWSEIKTITTTYLNLETNEVKTDSQVFSGFSAGIARAMGMSNYLLLGISVEFEDGYSGYSYDVKERDHTTNYDYTNISLDSPYRKYYIVVYDANKKEIGTIEGSVYYDVACVETNKWGGWMGNLSYFDIDLFTCNKEYANSKFKVSFREEILDGESKPTGEYEGYHEDIVFQSKVKKHSDSEYVNSITLTYGKNEIDWKMTITYKNITYTYTKSFVVYMQADDSVEIIEKLWDGNEEDAYSYLSYKGEKLIMDRPSTKVHVREQNGALLPVTKWDEVSIEDFELTMGHINLWSSKDENGNQTLYENVKVDIKGDPVFVDMYGYKFIKYTLTYPYEGKTIETDVYIRLMLNGQINNNVGFDAVVADNRTIKDIDYYVDPTSIDIVCSIQSLSVDTDNNQATITIKDANGVVLITKEGYLDEYTFKASGTYTMTITATDGSTKDITINVTGNYVADIKIAIKADGDNADKSLICDIKDGNGTSVGENSDFTIGVNDQMMYSFIAYAGANHGFKITESDGKRYLSITSFESAWYTDLYKMDGTKITSYPISLEILTDGSNDEYVCVYVERIRGIKQDVKIYLCDKVYLLDFEIKTDKTSDADAQDLHLTGDILDIEEMTMDGNFQVMEDNMYGPMFVAFLGDLDDLGLDITTTDEVDYVTLNKMKSSMFTVFYDVEGTPLSDGSTLQIMEDDGVKYLLIVGAMGDSVEEQMVIAIFFCEEEELPDAFFGISDDDQGPTDPSDPTDPTNPSDTDNSNNQNFLMGITATTGTDNMLISLNYDSENNGFLATSEAEDQKVQDLEVVTESSNILIKCNYIVYSLEYFEEGNTVNIAIGLCDEWTNESGWKILVSGDESDPKDITFESDQITLINAKLAMCTDPDSLSSEDESNQKPYFAFVLSNETLGVSITFNCMFTTSDDIEM